MVLFLNNSLHERISNFDWSLVFRAWGHYRICKSKASHAHRETKEFALYFSDCMVSDSCYENLIARSSGSSNSAISGNVLRKYSRLSLNGHLYKTDISVKRTLRVGPCLSLLPLFDSL